MISRLRTMFNRFHENPRTFIDITKYGHEQYQDIIINNEIIKKATRNRAESELRFRIIQDILDRYMRPFTMLDIGASQGYYSFRTAHNYDCVCVMIEGDNAHYPKVGRQLLDLCKANTSLENIILLNKHITLPDLKRLSECESFDVVLALNIIHWFGDRWQQVADAVLAMGDKIIIETPPLENFATSEQNTTRKSIQDYLSYRGAKIIAEVPRHTSDNTSFIYFFETEKKTLNRKQWLMPAGQCDHLIIDSNYKTKTLVKKLSGPQGTRANKWVPGINLMTFLMYHGAHPSRSKIKQMIKNMACHTTHNDWTANNMILQGNKLQLIDWDDSSHGISGGRMASSKVLKRHLRLAGIKKPEKIEKFFWNRLIKS